MYQTLRLFWPKQTIWARIQLCCQVIFQLVELAQAAAEFSWKPGRILIYTLESTNHEASQPCIPVACNVTSVYIMIQRTVTRGIWSIETMTVATWRFRWSHIVLIHFQNGLRVICIQDHNLRHSNERFFSWNERKSNNIAECNSIRIKTPLHLTDPCPCLLVGM